MKERLRRQRMNAAHRTAPEEAKMEGSVGCGSAGGKRRGAVLIAAVLLLVLGLLAGCGQSGDGNSEEISIGSMPKESATDQIGSFQSFATLDLDGHVVTEEVLQQAKYTLISVWGTYCGNCIDSMGEIEKLYQEYKDKGLNVLGIVIDAQDQEGQPDPGQVGLAKEILNENGVTYDNVISSMNLIYGVNGFASAIPAYAFVDQEGTIVGTPMQGGRSFEEWVEIIEKELEL